MLSLIPLLLIAPDGALTPDRLTCEYRVNPVGINVSKPRLGWIVTSGKDDERQTAYQIRVATSEAGLAKADVWDSGVVKSDATVGVEYGGPSPTNGQRLYWNVTVWDAAGKQSAPSRAAYWEEGIDKGAWRSQWISKQSIAAPLFRKDFSVHRRVVRARLYATAKGLYRATIDGQPIGSGELTPGWTDFRKRIQYQTYDVTSFLKRGDHTIGLKVAPGWYSGHVAFANEIYGTYPLAMASLRVTYADGTTETIGTDASWQAASGAIQSSDLLMGEEFDARKEQRGWDRPGFKGQGWRMADATPDGDELLVGEQGPMVEKLMELKVQKVTEPKPGTYVCDLGQNMVGWARLRVSGEAGTKVQLRFAEVLNKDGSLYTTNLRKAKATDTYVLSGEGNETFEPSFTFHGFRYVEVTGYPGKFAPSAITGEVVGSNVPRTGTFACSDSMVNQLQHNIEWGMRGNYVDIPTDCPQRDERLGWMGDAETFAPTAAFIGNIDGFMTKWLRDVDEAQTADGSFTDVSPNVLGPDGAPAWGDAGVIVPWDVFVAYGDTQLLAQNYPAMKMWVDRIDRYNPNHLWQQHRGNDYGDWLNVHDETPKELIATAFYANSVRLVAESAKALGLTDDAKRYDALNSAIKDAYIHKFVVNTGSKPTMRGDSQTSYILTIAFDMSNVKNEPNGGRELTQVFGDRLAELIAKRNDHLSAGFVGVGRLMGALTATGHADVAYKLLLQKTYPGWLYPITQGATTIWERWDGYRDDKGFQDPGMNSFNHYAMGAVGDWMYSSLAGIALDPSQPGYKHFVLAPQLGGPITWASAKLSTVHGDIESSWHKTGKHVTWDVVVPANTKATIILPDQRYDAHIAGGHHHFVFDIR